MLSTGSAANQKVSYTAIIAINLFAIGSAGNSIFFKMAAKEGGAQVIDYTVMRNISILTVSIIQLIYTKTSPFSNFPKSHANVLFWRCMTGQLGFFLVNTTLLFIPIYLQCILFQLACFWISILGYCINREKMTKFEITGLFVCFIGVVILSL